MTAIENVTHNTKLFVLANPVDKDLHVPAGHHVKIRALVEGMRRGHDLCSVVLLVFLASLWFLMS